MNYKNDMNLIFINLISFKDNKYYFEEDMIYWFDFIVSALKDLINFLLRLWFNETADKHLTKKSKSKKKPVL